MLKGDFRGDLFAEGTLILNKENNETKIHK